MKPSVTCLRVKRAIQIHFDLMKLNKLQLNNRMLDVTCDHGGGSVPVTSSDLPLSVPRKDLLDMMLVSSRITMTLT